MGPPAVVSGSVLEWDDAFLDHPELLAGAVVYDKGQTPLFRTAYIVEKGASALLMAEGGKNYHPLILASEAGMPAIAGIGRLPGLAAEVVTVDVEAGAVYAGSEGSQAGPHSDPAAVSVPPDAPQVYVNVGYPSALAAASRAGAAGVGLLRTEFAAVKTLALHLNQPLDDGRRWRDLVECPGGNEADAVYAIAQDKKGKKLLKAGFSEVVGEALARFDGREVIVRTLDLARRLDEPMGNRGIRRCVGSGGETLRVLCQAIREVLAEQGGKVGLILPLVSHYGQIRTAVECLLESGLCLQQPGSNAPYPITFGWEIEQPAASQNHRLWTSAFAAEFGQPPHMIGIGTNDLTQFTIALGRDAASEETDAAATNYLSALYDERDYSIVRQILEAAVLCRQMGTRVFLLGQAGADPLLAPLMFAYGVTPSVAPSRVNQVQRMAIDYRKSDTPEAAIQRYRNWVIETYPAALKETLIQQLDGFFLAIPAF